MSGPARDPVERCWSCLAAVEADHDFCLQCGARTSTRPTTPHRVVRSSGIAGALAAAILLGAGVAIAFGLSRDHDVAATRADTVPAFGTTALPVQPVVSGQPVLPANTVLTIPTLPTGTAILTAPTGGFSTSTIPVTGPPATASIPAIVPSTGSSTATSVPSAPTASSASIPSVTRPTSIPDRTSTPTFPSTSVSVPTTPITPTAPTVPTAPTTSTSTTAPSTSTAVPSAANCSSAAKLRPVGCDANNGPGTGSDGGITGPVGRDTWQRDDWPAHETAFACILGSRPIGSSSYTRMQARERAAVRRGLANLGLLFSDHFTPSLDAGYFVLYSGPFASRAEAVRVCRSARDNGYPTAYVRHIAA